MQVSIIVFQTDYYRFNTLAVDTTTQIPYKREDHSISEVIDCLQGVGVVTEAEADELQMEMNFEGGCPLFKGIVDDDALEEAGFVRDMHSKPN